jgi:hypothetical protein
VSGAQLRRSGADGLQRGQVELLNREVGARRGLGDAGGRALALLDVPHCQHHRRAAGREDPSRVESQPGVGTGEH